VIAKSADDRRKRAYFEEERVGGFRGGWTGGFRTLVSEVVDRGFRRLARRVPKQIERVVGERLSLISIDGNRRFPPAGRRRKNIPGIACSTPVRFGRDLPAESGHRRIEFDKKERSAAGETIELFTKDVCRQRQLSDSPWTIVSAGEIDPSTLAARPSIPWRPIVATSTRRPLWSPFTSEHCSQWGIVDERLSCSHARSS